MNEMQVFSNDQFGQVRTVQRDGQPWFVAADVCRALELGNPTMSLSRLDDDEKMTINSTEGHSGQRGGAQMMNIVNEPGLYTLVLGSRKPEAKSFKRWITHEVIPAIRKTGAYAIPGTQADAALKRAEAMLKNAQTRQFNAIMKAASDPRLSSVAAEVFGLTALENMTGREISYRPQVEKTYSAGDLAQEFGISGAMIGIIANKNDLKTPEYGMWVLDKAKGHDKQVQNFRYNEKGRERIRQLIEEKKA